MASTVENESASSSTPVHAAPGSSWNTKDSETQNIPENRLPIVCFGLALCIFLAAIDQVWSLYHPCHLWSEIMLIDYCCDCFTYYRLKARRREALQLGWKVSLSVVQHRCLSIVGSTVHIYLAPLRSPHYMANYQT
jgi:hypothetical protein